MNFKILFQYFRDQNLIKMSLPYVKFVQISSVEGIATQHKKASKVLTRVTPVPKTSSLQNKA